MVLISWWYWMADLLDQLALLDWLPEETLFSLVSRLHRLWGFPLAGQTCMALFGHPQQGAQHDLPSRLATLVSRTNGRLGTAVELARTRTLLAYYAPFISTQVIDAAVASMASDSVAHLKLKLGILTSRFRANHPLKSCPQCIREDVERHGWAYWHAPHQFPGVWVCPAHERWLQVSSLKSTGVGRFHWVLPSQSRPRPQEHGAGLVANESIEMALSFARLVVDVTSNIDAGTYTASLLEGAYRRRLSEFGWIGEGGRFRWSDISESYCRHVRTLVGCADIPDDMHDRERVAVQLGRMLRGSRSGTHPLRHYLIIHWLFADFNTFTSSVEALSATALSESRSLKSEKPYRSQSAVGDKRHAQLRELLIAGQCTLTGAARTIGIDVATAMAWATKMNIPVLRRPKTLKDDVRNQAIGMLRSGVAKADVARQVGVSIQTVTRLLLTELGLHEAWRDSRHSAHRNRYRAVWQELVHNYGAAGVKILRAMEPAAYVWLYRHDRDWLNEHKPRLKSAESSRNANRVDWDSRDRSLSHDVRVVAERLRLPL
ncbi:MAG: hypothetical protein EKK47_18680 [Burkholderiales bacterium]|nr:MAG: hypothetical protein EKK47_18680 [Burkholderiales bacterium]